MLIYLNHEQSISSKLSGIVAVHMPQPTGRDFGMHFVEQNLMDSGIYVTWYSDSKEGDSTKQGPDC